MAESGLPCFSRGAPVANLRRRFHLELSDAQVGRESMHMHVCCHMGVAAFVGYLDKLWLAANMGL
jgi:hypothetical protein